MISFLFLFLSRIIQDSNFINISLKPNEKKIIDLNGLLLTYVNSFQHSSDDIIFHHTKNGLVSDFDPSNHLSFREGTLEVFSKNGVSFPAWVLPSESCTANNYVVEPSQMAMLQLFFDSTPKFCIFTHFNFPFSALLVDTLYNLTTSVKLQKSNWIRIQNKKTYSVSEPFILSGEVHDSLAGDVSIYYTVGNGKCNVAKIKEGNQNWPGINIECQNTTRPFNMWLWLFVIILGFAIVFSLLIYFRFINLKLFWFPERISNNTFANRVEEHLEIEESPETNSQIDDTPETNKQQPSPDAL